MLGKSKSYLLAGFLLGVLLSTGVFALCVRHVNSERQNNGTGMILKLGHSLDQQHPVHLALEHMAQRLQEKSAGSVELQIFPNGQLGSETECIEQLQRGALDMTKTSTAPLEGFLPEFAIFGVPYLFRDDAHAWQVYTGEIGNELLLKGSEVGLRGLCYLDAGARSFYTVKKPILTPNDLKGLKIRVQESQTAMEMVEALGGSPTPMSFGELYTGLQQGMVDGAENNPPSFYSNRHFEVCKHLSLDEHARVPDILLISEPVWKNLSPQVQQWVKESADEAAEFQRKLWQEKTAEVLQAVEQQGVTVHHPDKLPFAQRVKPMVDKLQETPIGSLIKRIQELP
ncbi:TRAP transporter substrate-binding protein [Bythopirellula goksoeyrii]|uniref:2,3-diketo-L-gulonate-binding periplasmic protein YiaO n=1 Tax=Bythopirellula goksoeyrii TaxID=1400387 RepID=A0A5B9QQQ1_9BACT|nr:TRAP transporter substrate-binding protein [Bythopirellula goksoeyrii]QEG36451.1 2,3-diketo-L-gulonate-binding periplasmic protein YiaO precursor [Bythopirellula goksoeyrii]